jgi:hypothetical protein
MTFLHKGVYIMIIILKLASVMEAWSEFGSVVPIVGSRVLPPDCCWRRFGGAGF